MAEGRLERRLGLPDAVVIGAGSMVGAGVFTVWAPAAAAAGTALLLGLALAGLVAFANATSSADLAAVHPESGGTYVYARHRLGPGWGHLAGWGFVVGKTSSSAAMALTIGAYLWPGRERAVALLAIAFIVTVNLQGITRTALITRILLAVSLTTLAAVVGAGWLGDPEAAAAVPTGGDVLGILQAAAFCFFAFAGYARIATLGEEVKDPTRTIPRAVPLALGFVLLVYLVVGVTLLATTPIDEIAATDAPLELVVADTPLDGIVRVGAGIAALGVLLNLLAGISRTTLAMARRREFPSPLSVIAARRSVPARAELTVAVVVALLVLVFDLRDAIGFSSVAVLTYYALTNASALRLTDAERRWPRLVPWFGLVGCVTLAMSLPPITVVAGAAVLGLGALVRWLTVGRSNVG
ncbi:MAG: APC family permease [Acidimicrobiia bacterium]